MTTSAGPVLSGPHPPEGWDAFVAGAGGTFCHLGAWREIFSEAFGHEMIFAWIEDQGEIRAGLPLVSMPDLPVGRALMSLPYLNYGGPLGSPEDRAQLAEWARGEAERRGVRRLVLRSLDPIETPGLVPGRSKVTVLLPLPDDPKTLFEDGFRSKLRSQIRRPMKEDMETRFGRDQLDPFYRIFAENMRDLGTPVLPRALFRSIADHLSNRVDFGAVYHEGRVVAVGCGFHFEGEFEMTWASSLSRYNRLSPNMLLYWRFMERAIERGNHTFNFGRCTPGAGTHRFKLQWGEAHDRELAWRSWPERDGEDGGESAGDSGPGLAQRVWQRLPLPIANRLGPIVARRLTAF